MKFKLLVFYKWLFFYRKGKEIFIWIRIKEYLNMMPVVVGSLNCKGQDKKELLIK